MPWNSGRSFFTFFHDGPDSLGIKLVAFQGIYLVVIQGNYLVAIQGIC
jgi:hypothetical protein